MRRRDVLRTCGAAGSVAGLAALAGCSSGDDAESDAGSVALELAEFDHAESDSGDLLVTATVENAGDAEGSGTLYVTVEAGEDVTRESRAVTVAAGESTTVEIEVGFAYERFRSGGSLSFDLRTD
ncbi:hypothetical protein [Halorussus marinus]|uniref:hypothetical protein n=1 Tax=Halorussus marinus TaxID=2505976 RepID=UPI00106EC360|nr:hypothetical protein [Halorussus marinus]